MVGRETKKNVKNFWRRKMKSKKGFTLIELMVVILIVGILAAVLVPMLQGAVNAARFSEGKAGAGTIATALKAFVAEQGDSSTLGLTGTISGTGSYTAINLETSDLQGKYFSESTYSTAYTYDATATGATPKLTYTITVTAPTGGTVTGTYTLDQAGATTGP